MKTLLLFAVAYFALNSSKASASTSTTSTTSTNNNGSNNTRSDFQAGVDLLKYATDIARDVLKDKGANSANTGGASFSKVDDGEK